MAQTHKTDCENIMALEKAPNSFFFLTQPTDQVKYKLIHSSRHTLRIISYISYRYYPPKKKKKQCQQNDPSKKVEHLT